MQTIHELKNIQMNQMFKLKGYTLYRINMLIIVTTISMLTDLT